jgi:hypothetical protein
VDAHPEGQGDGLVSEAVERLRAAIQEVVSDDLERNHGYLVGCVIVAEWADENDARWLTATARDVNGDSPAIWTVKGWLVQALDQADSEGDE